MIRTYLSFAFKYLVRQPSYSILSTFGFSLAFASMLFIYSHVSYQNSYDKHLETWDRVYRLSGEINLPDNENTHALLGPRLSPEMKAEIPAIDQVARLFPFQEKCIIQAGDQVYFEEQVYYADNAVFEVFPLQFLYGTPGEALVSEGQVVIAESIAKKYFGTSDALGKQLILNSQKKLEVTGVTKDLPLNVHHKMHLLLSMNSLNPAVREGMEGNESENYWRPSVYHFILLGEKNSIEEVETAFPAFYDKYMAEFGSFLKAEFKLIITALPDLHFSPQYSYDLPKGNRSYSYLLMGAGVFLLLIALLNYINLLSASMASRTRSLGVFKINGAERSHVYKLLITEAMIIIVISAGIACFLFTGAEAWFREQLGGAIPESGFRSGSFLVLVLLVFAAFTLSFLLSVISRVYGQPILLLKGSTGRSATNRRYGLGKGSIILQFTLSVILIISSLLITRQVKYLLKADVGFNTDNIVQVKLHAEGLPLEKIFSFKNELKKSSLVKEAAYSSNVPGEVLGTSHFKVNLDGQEASKIVSTLAIDADYIPMMEMEFREGRNFDPDRSGDSQGGLILNEACISFLGMGDSLVGKYIQQIEILGVLKSGKYNSLRNDSRPVALYLQTGNRGYMNVKLNTSDLPAALDYIRKSYDTFFTNIPFEYSFMDQTVEDMYRNDINQSRMLGIFTILSIVIANIGLFGLVALLNRKRIREIGIRKVNGAHKWQIVMLLGKQLIAWVAIAVIIALPVTWYLSRLWLQNFASRISFSWWIIPLGGMIILISALVTTAFITLKAANRNPVETIRYE